MAGKNYFDSNRRNTVILKFEAVNGDALVVNEKNILSNRIIRIKRIFSEVY
jgi:hypothetical protein